jgi:hypothetical protein
MSTCLTCSRTLWTQCNRRPPGRLSLRCIKPTVMSRTLKPWDYLAFGRPADFTLTAVGRGVCLGKVLLHALEEFVGWRTKAACLSCSRLAGFGQPALPSCLRRMTPAEFREIIRVREPSRCCVLPQAGRSGYSLIPQFSYVVGRGKFVSGNKALVASTRSRMRSAERARGFLNSP